VEGLALPPRILNMTVPQVGQVPLIALRPFFMVSSTALEISFLALHFTQYPSGISRGRRALHAPGGPGAYLTGGVFGPSTGILAKLSGENAFHDLAMYVREPEIAPLKPVSEPLVGPANVNWFGHPFSICHLPSRL
jgi:hypothetical protein